MKRLKLFFSVLCLVSLLSSSFTSHAKQVSEYKFDVESLDGFGCNTFSVGINIDFIYIETTVTLCCVDGDVFMDCIRIRGKEVKGSLEHDVTKLLNKHNVRSIKSLEITSSSAYINTGNKIKIRQGVYKVSKDNLVNFKFIVVD